MHQFGMQQNMINLYYKKTEITLNKLRIKDLFKLRNFKEKISKNYIRIYYSKQLKLKRNLKIL